MLPRRKDPGTPLPDAYAVAAVVIVTQTLVEVIGMVATCVQSRGFCPTIESGVTGSQRWLVYRGSVSNRPRGHCRGIASYSFWSPLIHLLVIFIG